MTIGLPRSGLLLLILACTVRAALAQAPAAPLQYADDFAELGQSVAASGLPIMLVFTRPGCPFCARAKQDHLEPLNASPGYGAKVCLLYTSDAADERSSVDLGGRRIIKKKKGIKGLGVVPLENARTV